MCLFSRRSEGGYVDSSAETPPGWDWARADAPFTFVKGALSALGLAPPFGEPCVREWAPQPRGPRFALGGAGGYVVLSY